MGPTILTVGHSSHSFPDLVELLKLHDVSAIADVRSAPYSRLHPEFNREALADSLRDHGIAYVFLGRELGARSLDPACYENGRVQYRRLAQTAQFRGGLERILTGAQSHRIALLCAEKEPLACHRMVLVARELEALGATVQHIHADGQLESHGDALHRLLTTFGMQDTDLFRTREEVLDEAYARQEQRIAYVDDELRAPAAEEA